MYVIDMFAMVDEHAITPSFQNSRCILAGTLAAACKALLLLLLTAWQQLSWLGFLMLDAFDRNTVPLLHTNAVLLDVLAQVACENNISNLLLPGYAGCVTM